MSVYLDRIAHYLFTQTWQITLLVLMLAMVSWLLSNRSAHIPYFLC